MINDVADYSRILENISSCRDPEKLYVFIDNAQKKGVEEISDAAIRQLASLVPKCRPGSLDHDFWQTLSAYELVLREDRKSKVTLFKSRKKVEEQGIPQTLTDWTMMDKHRWVFNRLVEKNMADLTGDAVILRHPKIFDKETKETARKRLQDVAKS